jgi:putative endonuclease
VPVYRKVEIPDRLSAGPCAGRRGAPHYGITPVSLNFLLVSGINVNFLMERWSVYALWSRRYYRLYIGRSKKVAQRLTQHNKGQQKSIKAFMPWKLIFSEPCLSRQHTREREKYWKTGAGRSRLKHIAAKISKKPTDSQCD